jgi:hypothetical protein
MAMSDHPSSRRLMTAIVIVLHHRGVHALSTTTFSPPFRHHRLTHPHRGWTTTAAAAAAAARPPCGMPSSSSMLLLSAGASGGGGSPDEDRGGRGGDGTNPLPTSSTTTATTTTRDGVVPMKRQKRILTKEFFAIALPAFVQLAAEPLAGLVDTAYLGRLGPEVLGGAGVAISAQYAVGKLYNDPLLRTSISLVASEFGRRKNGGRRKKNDENEDDDREEEEKEERRALSMAVSSAMLLALGVGIAQLVLYYAFADSILAGMGVTAASGMHASAYSYMRVRALGTPAATLWLVTNGVYRGLGDTSTPLIYSILFTVLNAILDPIFIFTLGFGASGAAAGTAIAQYVALVPLVYSLHKRVSIDVFGMWGEMGGTLRKYLKAGSYVFVRTVGKVLAYSICARQAVSVGSSFVFFVVRARDGGRRRKGGYALGVSFSFSRFFTATLCSVFRVVGSTPHPTLAFAIVLRFDPSLIFAPTNRQRSPRRGGGNENAENRRCSGPSSPRPTISRSSSGSRPPRYANRSPWRSRPCWRARWPAATAVAAEAPPPPSAPSGCDT